MFRGLLFLAIAIPFLWLLDFWILLCRLAGGKKKVVRLLDRKTQSWGHGILNLMKLIQGVRIIEEPANPSARTLPPHFMVVSNHQSLLDIVLLFDLFRGHQIRFVAKRQLGKGFPGASQVLVYQEHALIEREGNLRATLDALMALGRRNRQTGNNAVIFPEGTRSRDGALRTFHAAGIKILADSDPCPLVICALDGGWRIGKISDFLRAGSNHTLRMKILDILPCPGTKEELRQTIETARNLIDAQIARWRSLPPSGS